MNLMKYILILIIAVFFTEIAIAAAAARDCREAGGTCRLSCEGNLMEIPGGAICQVIRIPQKQEISPKCCVKRKPARLISGKTNLGRQNSGRTNSLGRQNSGRTNSPGRQNSGRFNSAAFRKYYNDGGWKGWLTGPFVG